MLPSDLDDDYDKFFNYIPLRQNREGDSKMEKKFLVSGHLFATKEEAINKAKRNVSGGGCGTEIIYQAIAKVEAPVPEAVVTDL